MPEISYEELLGQSVPAASKEIPYEELAGAKPKSPISDDLLDALAWVESRHNPNAVSPAGAMGK